MCVPMSTPDRDPLFGYLGSGLGLLVLATPLLVFGLREDSLGIVLIGVAFGIVATITTLIGTIAAGVSVGMRIHARDPRGV